RGPVRPAASAARLSSRWKRWLCSSIRSGLRAAPARSSSRWSASRWPSPSGPIRGVARAASSAAMPACTQNRSWTSRFDSGATTNPRLGSRTTNPSLRSDFSASLTGVTLTPNSMASRSSRRRSPGRTRPARISSRMRAAASSPSWRRVPSARRGAGEGAGRATWSSSRPGPPAARPRGRRGPWLHGSRPAALSAAGGRSGHDAFGGQRDAEGRESGGAVLDDPPGKPLPARQAGLVGGGGRGPWSEGDADEDRLVDQLDAERVADASAHLAGERQEVGGLGAARVGEGEGVLGGDARRADGVALAEAGAVDQPGGGRLDPAPVLRVARERDV